MKLEGDRNLISSAAPRLPHRSLQIKQFNSKAVRVIQQFSSLYRLSVTHKQTKLYLKRLHFYNYSARFHLCHLRYFRVSFQMFPQMCLQILFPNRCKGTLVAFVCFFARVNFHMSLQILFPNRCKGTLVAFVCSFTRVNFHMCPQIASLNGCKVAQVAFVWFFSIVNFHMRLQIAFLNRCKVTLHYRLSPI